VIVRFQLDANLLSGHVRCTPVVRFPHGGGTFFAPPSPPAGLLPVRYSMILVTTPAPTVRPPSRMAKRRPSSIAIGEIKLDQHAVHIVAGMTMSVPAGSDVTPVTSVVRK